jgi:hypothetical protein
MASTFVPLNSFKSVVYKLTGQQDEVYITPQGVSTIVLSAQITNNSYVTQPVTISILSNAFIPVPDFTGIYSTSSFTSASALIRENANFLRYEVEAYTAFQNNLSDNPFVITASRFENYATIISDALQYDIENSSTIRTNKAALSFYDKDGKSAIYDGEFSASIFAVQYTNTLIQEIIKNQSVTGSTNVNRLYQTQYTQSIDNTYQLSDSELTGSSFLINQLSNVIVNVIQTPFYVAQDPIQLVRNVTIPSADSLSPVVAGKLVLQAGYGFVVSGSPDISVILSLLESANE